MADVQCAFKKGKHPAHLNFVSLFRISGSYEGCVSKAVAGSRLPGTEIKSGEPKLPKVKRTEAMFF
jgi:hypothetical protein